MDKYLKQAGDHTYDSDDEADDEFERSEVGIISPTVPDHFDDDDLSDHPSESEDEDGYIDGEDTPTTQAGWDRDGRSPTGKITQWTEDQVADYIASLAPALKQYGQNFVDEKVDGLALISLQHDDLRELGINSVGHRMMILKSVYESKRQSGVKMEEGDYVPLSADQETDAAATQEDIARVINSIRLRDERIIEAEQQLRKMKQDLERISEENRKLREETLPVLRLVKDQRTPLPDPSAGSIPSPRDAEALKQNETQANANKGTSLSRKFSKKLLLGGAPKQTSPTHPPTSHTPQPREVRDDGGTHLEASAAAMAASSHLTASMTSQTSPNSVQGSQLSPTSPAYSSHAPSSGGSYQHPQSAAQRSFPRDGQQSARQDRGYGHTEDTCTGFSSTSGWSQASTAVPDPPLTARTTERRRQGAPTPSPRDDNDGTSTRDRYAAPTQPQPKTPAAPRPNTPLNSEKPERDNPQVEIFKSFRVSIEDPCRVVLPVALKRYNITDDWRQYALYIVHGDQERCLGLEEKPLLLFKQLDKEGRKPMFMLRRHAAPAEGWSSTGGVYQGHTETAGGGGSGKQIPGGVL